MKNNGVIKRSLLLLLLKILNSREKRICTNKAKGKAINKKSARITHSSEGKITEKKKTYSSLNAKIMAKWAITLSRVQNPKRVKKAGINNLKNKKKIKFNLFSHN